MLRMFNFWSTRGDNSHKIRIMADAIRRGQLSTVENLLSLGLDPNARDERGYTLIHLAAFATRSGQEEYMLPITQILLDFGADPCVFYNKLGESYCPLHTAVRKKLPETLDVLLSNGAMKSLNLRDGRGKTPGDYAQEYRIVDANAEIILLSLQAANESFTAPCQANYRNLIAYTLM